METQSHMLLAKNAAVAVPGRELCMVAVSINPHTHARLIRLNMMTPHDKKQL